MSSPIAGPQELGLNQQSNLELERLHGGGADEAGLVEVSSGEKDLTNGDGEEQALESHEVIELQTFSERKAWIEEKIKFLGNMPPIEVFVGLDALRNSAYEVPGLPTPDELQQWIAEHDAIEKETEIFDTGELKKLRQLTKAATQRNLSPEDTDVIELTLTTIYELDKLLHLLRDRSENLDLLSIRLTWEENRIASWKDRKTILDDLEMFIDTRARWSPSIYEVASIDESPDPSRSASVTSLASASSDISLSSPAFSRSARFKLAELLSRDAAQFAGRVTTLRHGKVTTTGKALDKLIDNSRKPVPEELLDEQDRLEEKSINEMENVGKFSMGLVMQWRKADEIYVETMKDQVAAQELIEDIETAQLHHPTFRQTTSFSSRLDTILKRLSARGNPASKMSLFPRPEHPLFPQQRVTNEALVSKLASDITTATSLSRKVETAVKKYHEAWEAVRHVEIMINTANELTSSIKSIMQRLNEGVPDERGEGSVPDLTSEDCLEPSQHSVFLALLPSIQSEATQVTAEVDSLTRSSEFALYALSANVDPVFKSNAISTIQTLSRLRDEVGRLGLLASKKVARLREARHIWTSMDMHLKEMQIIREQVSHNMERDCWKQQVSNGNGAPPTPESPVIELKPLAILHADLGGQLSEVGTKLVQDVESPLSTLSSELEQPLMDCLSRRAQSLRVFHASLLRMNHLHDAIQSQADAMSSAQEACNGFLIRFEDLKMRFVSLIQKVLSSDVSVDDAEGYQANLISELISTQDDALTFTSTLSSRVIFVSRQSPVSPTRTAFLRQVSESHGKSESLQDNIALHLPFDLSSIDAAVRADSNSYVMRLGGALESITKTSTQLEVALMAKELDVGLFSTIKLIRGINDDLNSFQASFADITKQFGDDSLERLDVLLKEINRSVNDHRPRISRCFSPMRELLRRMDASSNTLDHSVKEELYASRWRAVDDAEIHFGTWEEGIMSLKDGISIMRSSETQRQDEVRRAEQERRRVEAEHIAAAEAERVRIEILQRKKEEQKRVEEERQAEALRQVLERERKAAEKAERDRLEEVRKEKEEREKEEAERLEALARAQAEQERLAKIEAEKTLLLKERLAAEEKLRFAKAQLAEERRLQAERDRLSELKAEEDKLIFEQEEKEKMLHAQAVEEKRARAEFERAKVAEAERLRLETELESMRAERKAEQDKNKPPADVIRHQTVQSREQIHENELNPNSLNIDHLEHSDVFGVISSSSQQTPQSQEEMDLHALIIGLRKRLRSISINEVLRPSSKSSSLPTREQTGRMKQTFSVLQSDIADLPMAVDTPSISTELRSLRTEALSSAGLLVEIDKLVDMAEAVQSCDTALSDLLEHIDSYPTLPLSVSSLHRSVETETPEQQLSTRLAFTKGVMISMDFRFTFVANDQRAISERNRQQQTWIELEEMANDRIGGKKSRPVSVISSRPSSGRNSSASVVSRPAARKKESYSNLSVSSVPLKGGKLAPPAQIMTPRRAVSGSNESASRSTSRLSTISTNRSVSGPLSSSILGSTFASRQRTSSLSNSTSTPSRHPAVTPSRVRTHASQSKRTRSPSISESSTQSHSALPASRSTTTSTSTWARAPRNSLSSLFPRVTTPQKRMGAAPRKKYVPDPMNKLDVAVGDVVNQLPVGINVEGLLETWKDQSGKYWIGNQDPKLCFCRILRSQTVMVRVGGGWTELSKFIKDHFADSFRLLPESPPRVTGKYQEEKWISSSVLLEAHETETPPIPPRTPEPTVPFVPSFSLSTPSGQSPRSVKSTPSTKGSPLMPLQFMRRAEPDPALLRPMTPSKLPLRSRNTNALTPSRTLWRP